MSNRDGWSGCYVAAGLEGRHSNQLKTALMNTPLLYASSQRRLTPQRHSKFAASSIEPEPL